MVRVGHPARVMPSVMKWTLDSVVARSAGAEVITGIREDMTALFKGLHRIKDFKSRSREYQSAKRQRAELRKELREREKRTVAEVMKNANVVFSTCIGAASIGKDIKDFPPFDVCVIDEGTHTSISHTRAHIRMHYIARTCTSQRMHTDTYTHTRAPAYIHPCIRIPAAQSLEVESLIPLLKARKLILAGDHKQLGPVVKSEQALQGAKGGEWCREKRDRQFFLRMSSSVCPCAGDGGETS